jgi:hypothetical protein
MLLPSAEDAKTISRHRSALGGAAATEPMGRQRFVYM